MKRNKGAKLSFDKLDSFGPPSESDYALISELTPLSVPKDDLFVYSIVVADSLPDRDGEMFAVSALMDIASLAFNVPGIHDHNWEDTSLMHSRIFRADMCTDTIEYNGVMVPYSYVVAFCYTVRSEKNNDLIMSIGSGVLKEVSLGFEHTEPVDFGLSDGQTVKLIEHVTDVYEFSFVSVPAQPLAGTVKSFREVTRMPVNVKSLTAKIRSGKALEQAEAEDAAKMLEDADDSVKSLKAKIKELEDKVSDTEMKDAISESLKDATFVSDEAADLAYDMIKSKVKRAEDGSIEGLDDAVKEMKDKYSFFFSPDEKYEEDDEAKKEEDDAHLDAEIDRDKDKTKSATKAFTRPRLNVAAKSASSAPPADSKLDLTSLGSVLEAQRKKAALSGVGMVIGVHDIQ